MSREWPHAAKIFTARHNETRESRFMLNQEACQSLNIVHCNYRSRRKMIHKQQNANLVRGGADGGFLHSICASSSSQCSLNHFSIFFVKSQRVASRGHVVFMSSIWFRCDVRHIINLVMVVKKRSLTRFFITCCIVSFN